MMSSPTPGPGFSRGISCRLDFWGGSRTSMARDGVAPGGDLTSPILRDFPAELVVEGAETGPPCVQDFDDDGEYRIKMEILTPREVTQVLASLWIAVILCLVLDIGQNSPELRPVFGDCEGCVSSFQQYSGSVAGQAAGLNCSTSGDGGQVSSSISGLMPFNEFISLRGQVGGIVGDLCLGLMSSECYMNYTVKASSVAADGSAVVYESHMIAPLVCRAGQGCELSDLFVWGGPLKQRAYDFAVSDLAVHIRGKPVGGRIVSSSGTSFCDGLGPTAWMAVTLTTQHGTKVLVETVLRLVLAGVAVAALAYWLRCLSVSRSKVLPEQRCITAMFLALLLHDDPFQGPRLLYGGAWTHVSMCCNAMAVSLFLVLWLFLIDSLSHHSGRLQTWGSGSCFAKSAFGLCYAVVGFLRRANSSAAVITNGSVSGSFDKLSESGGYWAFAWLLLTWTWAYSFISLTYKASRTLRLLPYLETRYRQLSFQFFQLQSSIVCLYFLADLTLSLMFSGDLFILDAVTYSLPEAFLLEVYTFLVALVYLPASSTNQAVLGPLYVPKLLGRKGRSTMRRNYVSWEMSAQEGTMDDLFCLETARTAVHASFQAYLDPSRQRSRSGWGVLDAAALSAEHLEVVDFIHNSDCDIGALVLLQDPPAWGQNGERGGGGGARKVVVAFRGSSSLTNALTDINISQVSVPLDRLQPRHKATAEEVLHQVMGTVLRPVEAIERGASTLVRLLSGIRIHAGFWQAYERVCGDVMDAVGRYEEEITRGNCDVILTGHSLGGALAQLLALDLRMRLGTEARIFLYSFGSPRVGNRAFSDLFNIAVPRSFRVVLRNDVVTTLPGPPFFIHGGQEVVMDASGHVHCDPSVVERVFRPPRRSLSDHTMTAYIDAVETCLRVHGGIATPADRNSVDFDDTDDGDHVAVSS